MANHSDIQTLNWQMLPVAGSGGIGVIRMAPQPPYPPHDHVFHELAVVESGTAQHHTTQGVHPLRPGDVIVIRPQVWHAYERPQELVLINCFFEPAVLRRFHPLLAEIPQAFELFYRRLPRPAESVPQIVHASPTQRQVLLDRLSGMIQEQQEQPPGYHVAMYCRMLEVLLLTLRLRAQVSAPTPSPATDRTTRAVLQAAAHLESHYADTFSLAALANRAGLSPWHLSRSFSCVFKMGLVQFLHQVRCEEACRLLRCTTLSITEIAQRTGYDEIAYFTRIFTRLHGVSPRRYRSQRIQSPL